MFLAALLVQSLGWFEADSLLCKVGEVEGNNHVRKNTLVLLCIQCEHKVWNKIHNNVM
jgi:hypothetical protein